MSFDRALFILINARRSAGWLDWLMPRLTNAHRSLWFWIVALPLAAWAWRAGDRRVRTALALLVVMLPLANGVSSVLVKPLFHRPRPTWRITVAGKSEYVVAGARLPPHEETLGTSSFPSSHSATTACAGVILLWGFRRRSRWAWLALLLPFCIGYSRIYVGVHYPSDVLAGWALGALLGWGACRLAQRYAVAGVKKFTPNGLDISQPS